MYKKKTVAFAKTITFVSVILGGLGGCYVGLWILRGIAPEAFERLVEMVPPAQAIASRLPEN